MKTSTHVQANEVLYELANLNLTSSYSDQHFHIQPLNGSDDLQKQTTQR